MCTYLYLCVHIHPVSAVFFMLHIPQIPDHTLPQSSHIPHTHAPPSTTSSPNTNRPTYTSRTSWSSTIPWCRKTGAPPSLGRAATWTRTWAPTPTTPTSWYVRSLSVCACLACLVVAPVHGWMDTLVGPPPPLHHFITKTTTKQKPLNSHHQHARCLYSGPGGARGEHHHQLQLHPLPLQRRRDVRHMESFRFGLEKHSLPFFLLLVLQLSECLSSLSLLLHERMCPNLTVDVLHMHRFHTHVTTHTHTSTNSYAGAVWIENSEFMAYNTTFFSNTATKGTDVTQMPTHTPRHTHMHIHTSQGGAILDAGPSTR